MLPSLRRASARFAVTTGKRAAVRATSSSVPESPAKNNNNGKLLLPATASMLSTESSKVAQDTSALMRSVLLPLNDKFIGPLERKADDRTPLPLVFVLGNHSSGKSTFIVRFSLARTLSARG